jgi:dihydroorotase
MFHRTGLNVSDQTRVGINHLYCKYILKQQIDIPSLLNHKASTDPFLNMLLGFDSKVPTSVLEFRQIRNNKKNKKY